VDVVSIVEDCIVGLSFFSVRALILLPCWVVRFNPNVPFAVPDPEPDPNVGSPPPFIQTVCSPGEVVDRTLS
jgi:hypothetical protein